MEKLGGTPCICIGRDQEVTVSVGQLRLSSFSFGDFCELKIGEEATAYMNANEARRLAVLLNLAADQFST